MIKTNLAVLLAERGLKIADVYEATGISKTTLMAISENSGKGIQYDTVDKLCNFLEVEPKDFFVYSPYMISFSELKYDYSYGVYVDCTLKNGEYEKIQSLQLEFNNADNLKDTFDILRDKNLSKYDFVLSIEANLEGFYTSLPIQLKRDFRMNLIKNVLYAISHANLPGNPNSYFGIDDELDFIEKVQKIDKGNLNSFIYLNLENTDNRHIYLECTVKATKGNLTLDWFHWITMEIFWGIFNMKKGLTIAVSVMAALSLAACGNNKQSDELKKLRAEHSSLVKQSKQDSHKHKQKKHSTKSKQETKQSASKSNADSQSSANKQSNQQGQNKPANGGQQATTQANNSGASNNNASSANQTNAANNLEWDGTRRRDSFKSDADFQRYNAWHQGYNYDPNTGNMTPLDQQQLNQMRQEMNKDGGQSFQ